ncbi:hypothetical protein EV182_004023, partial [Spiromyces aspiralis]
SEGSPETAGTGTTSGLEAGEEEGPTVSRILAAFDEHLQRGALPEDNDAWVLHQFFVKTGWHNYVGQSGDSKELAGLLSPPEGPEDGDSAEFKGVHSLLFAYMRVVSGEIERVGDFLLLRWLANERGSVEALPSKGFKVL